MDIKTQTATPLEIATALRILSDASGISQDEIREFLVSTAAAKVTARLSEAVTPKTEKKVRHTVDSRIAPAEQRGLIAEAMTPNVWHRIGQIQEALSKDGIELTKGVIRTRLNEMIEAEHVIWNGETRRACRYYING